ncbi:hypothetical protein DPMN_150552 [Dreissena polymorpha]|uniref:Uncharacterized protein n=1 Tax=Dreissena polymorpha TaxID=45954 RepID=A0A9D4FHX3_DREPO|nr:hypothetical protein DPMN_150552 [Dreissena polymorpha]
MPPQFWTVCLVAASSIELKTPQHPVVDLSFKSNYGVWPNLGVPVAFDNYDVYLGDIGYVDGDVVRRHDLACWSSSSGVTSGTLSASGTKLLELSGGQGPYRKKVYVTMAPAGGYQFYL